MGLLRSHHDGLWLEVTNAERFGCVVQWLVSGGKGNLAPQG